MAAKKKTEDTPVEATVDPTPVLEGSLRSGQGAYTAPSGNIHEDHGAKVEAAE